MSVYDDLAQVARDLLDPGQLGAQAGAVTLVRKTIWPPANSWESPTITTTTEPLLAQVFGVSGELVGSPAQEPENGVVLASDRMVICAVPSIGYRAGDLVAVDGFPATVIRVIKIPAAGVTSALKFVIRGNPGQAEPPPPAVWILSEGEWSDAGAWDDTAEWSDAA